MKNFREDVDTLVTNFKKLCKPKEDFGIWYYVKEGKIIDVETRMNQYGGEYQGYESVEVAFNTIGCLEECLELSKIVPNYLEYSNNVKTVRDAYIRLLRLYSKILKDLGEHP